MFSPLFKQIFDYDIKQNIAFYFIFSISFFLVSGVIGDVLQIINERTYSRHLLYIN